MNQNEIDWYDCRDELTVGMVFLTRDETLVRLDRRVPGDGTRWYVEVWQNGHWSAEDDTIEPGDLEGHPRQDPSEAQ